MIVDLLRLTAPPSTVVLEVADHLTFFPVHADDRLIRTFEPVARALRAQIVPGKRGRGGSGEGQGSALPKRHAMRWAQRLKRVVGIEIESCEHRGAGPSILPPP